MRPVGAIRLFHTTEAMSVNKKISTNNNAPAANAATLPIRSRVPQSGASALARIYTALLSNDPVSL